METTTMGWIIFFLEALFALGRQDYPLTNPVCCTHLHLGAGLHRSVRQSWIIPLFYGFPDSAMLIPALTSGYVVATRLKVLDKPKNAVEMVSSAILTRGCGGAGYDHYPYYSGRDKMNVVPIPGSLAMVMVPPSNSAIFFATGRLIPINPYFSSSFDSSLT